MDPIALRGIERILITCGGIIFGYLGYRLFLLGIEKGTSSVTTESKFFKLVFTGTAPGLFFMFAGACILMTALVFGGAESRGGNALRSTPPIMLEHSNSISPIEAGEKP